MKKLVFVGCCVMVFASSAYAAEVYKWKDAKGHVQYSDSPPLSNIPYTTLSGKKPVNAPMQEADGGDASNGDKPDQAAAGKPAETKPADAKPGEDKNAQKKAAEQKAAKEAEAKKQQEEKMAAEKKVKEQACRSARAKVAQFKQGGRIYRINEKGEREYYGDAEIANELSQAQEDVDANCE